MAFGEACVTYSFNKQYTCMHNNIPYKMIFKKTPQSCILNGNLN